MTVTLTKWDAAEHLNTAENMQLYLEACMEDGALIRAALADIAHAKNMSELAQDGYFKRRT